MARAQTAAEGGNVVILGATLARDCLERGLLEEIVVHLAPVLLGDGVCLFSVAGGRKVQLEPYAVARSGRITDLRFRVA